MKNKNISNRLPGDINYLLEAIGIENKEYPRFLSQKSKNKLIPYSSNGLAEVLVITSFPPRECGIATYSQDLIKALNNKFSNSMAIKICALETNDVKYTYTKEVKYTLNTSNVSDYEKLARAINKDPYIEIVLIQHEFGLFVQQEQALVQLLYELKKPVVIVFHTVLPEPDELLKLKIKSIAAVCESIVVMTNTSANILKKNYGINPQKITVIAHGTHLVHHLSENVLKLKFGLEDRKVLTTFGLLSSGKNIETTLLALPAIIEKCPDVIFLIIGKTHPEVRKTEGEIYREKLKSIIKQYSLSNYVQFINSYLDLPDLLEYLQLTDIYLFTTNDPNQAVSGTFAYAMSCACPIISTPIPHAKEVLTKDTGIIIDFENSKQLAESVIHLLNDEPLRRNISTNTLQKIVSTVWENSAVAHVNLFEKLAEKKINIRYNLPAINLSHLNFMTTETGIIQFSKINQPDISSGYTLDDNARALVATCMYFKLTGDQKSIPNIHKYLNFIKYCQKPSGNFTNYVDSNLQFTDQNNEVNLDDANGRALWALGYLISAKSSLPNEIISKANKLLQKKIVRLENMHSTRSMAFTIKGFYYYNKVKKSPVNESLIKAFANRLVEMYKHESKENWQWFESYLTYANSILPEAMLYAWLLTCDTTYKDIAISSFNFLLSKTFNENGIEVISNKKWMKKGEKAGSFGEQPIDVAYTIMTLAKFYDVFSDESYRQKMVTAFNWFLGNNRLHQIIYNPCTGGCYDGLEESNVNLNQGAESTVSYLMARLTMEKYRILDKLENV